jgi:oligopeptide transport system substrate-binding protein
VLPFLLLLALLMAVAAYDHSPPRAPFVMAQTADAFTLDPARVSWQQDIRVTGALYEPLIRKNPYDRRDEPGVAESWHLDDAGTTWTFHLRPDARWSNGDPVVAEDFVAAFRRCMLPDSASDYSGFFFAIDGAEDFFNWRTQALAEYAAAARRGEGGTPEAADALWQRTLQEFGQRVALRAVDDHTLEMRLRQPVSYWLSLLGFPVMSPVHRPTLAANSRLEPATGRVLDDPAWTKAGVSVTNGPYRLAQWRYRRMLRLEKNPFYWDRDNVALEAIDILPIMDDNTAVLAYMAGSVDWVSEVRIGYRVEMVEELRRYLERHRAQYEALKATGLDEDEVRAALPEPQQGERRDIHVLPAFGTDFYSFNCRPTLPDGRANPFHDARVRRAFALAIDKQLLADRVIRTGEPVAGSLVPKGAIPGYTPPAGLPFDPERARAELAAAGWADRDGDGKVEDAGGKPFPTVDLLYSTNGQRYRDLTLALSDMWRRTLGVPVELRGKETKFFKDDLIKGDFMIGRGGWYGDFEDPTTFLDLSRSTDGNNDRKYASAEFDALLDRAAEERDPARRLEILREAETLLMERDVPMLPLTHFATIYLYDPVRVRGLTRNPRLEQKLGRVSVIEADAKPAPRPAPSLAPSPAQAPSPATP